MSHVRTKRLLSSSLLGLKHGSVLAYRIAMSTVTAVFHYLTHLLDCNEISWKPYELELLPLVNLSFLCFFFPFRSFVFITKALSSLMLICHENYCVLTQLEINE